MYNTLQVLHVAAALVWIGSGVGLVALFATIQRARDTQTMMAVSRHMENLGGRLFGPAAGATLLFGVLAVIVGDIAWEETWIVIGVVGVVISFVIVMINNPLQKRLGATVQEHGPDHADVAAIMRRSRTLNLIDLVVLFVVVWAMVVKPGS